MTSRRKIAFCITHTELGGAQKYVYNLIKRLRNSYDLYCVSSFSGELRKDFHALEGVRLVELKELTRRIDPFRDFIAFLRLRKLFRTHRFSLIHFNSPKIAFLGRVALFCCGSRPAVFYTFHLLEFSFPCRNLKERLYKAIEKILSAITDCLIVNSEYERKVLLGHGFAGNKVHLVYPGIESASFVRVARRRSVCPLGPRPLRLLHITSFKPQKDTFFFLRFSQGAVARLPSLQVDILGDGPLRKKAEDFIARRGLSRNIRIHGWQRDVGPFLEQAGYLVVTSHRESLSYAVLEAVLSGVPVLSTYKGALTEILKEGVNGYFFPKESRRMALSVTNMLQNPLSADTMKEVPPVLKNEDAASFWSTERMTNQIEEFYREYLTKDAE